MLAILVANKKPPKRPDVAERARVVSIVEVQKATILPRIKGYGYVEASEVWEAIPEVSGKVIEMHPELKKGAFVKKGELLIRIDPETYGLAKTKGAASVMSIDAQLLELDQEKANTKRLLEIEKRSLTLTQREVERKRELYKKGYISASDLESEEKNLLSQQTTVKNLINSLDLIPSRRKALLAQKKSDVSSLSEMELELTKTIIRAPFDCRVSEVNIEKNQFTSVGQTVVKAYNLAKVEIPVQLSAGDFINLLSPSSETLGEKLMRGDFNMDMLRTMIGIQAKVRLPLFTKEAEWDGNFLRVSESMDLATGALTIYVGVNNPYDHVQPGVRPPLVPNMYCEVELLGKVRSDRFIVPVSGVHQGELYLLGSDSRLQRKKVHIEMVMNGMAVIAEGLQNGDKVVTTDLVPAIEGQLLKPVPDVELMAEIERMAVQR